MRIIQFTIGMVAVSLLTGCPSHRQSCQVSYNQSGTAHISNAVVEVAPEVPSLPAAVILPAEVLRAKSDTPPQVIPAIETVLEPKPLVLPPIRSFGHSGDYSWLIGKLQRVHVRGNQWKIRYAPLDAIDRWGGSMLLAPDIRLEEFSDGDTVRVEGEILAERPSLYVAGPLYRIRSIRGATTQDRMRRAR